VDDQQSRARTVVELREGMARLGWGVGELWSAAIELGDVGSESDVREHLATGNHLSSAQHLVLVAAVRDAGLGAGGEGAGRDGERNCG
jgi:hypothetical protein